MRLALMAFLAAQGGAWTRKGWQLLSLLNTYAPEGAVREKSWPRDPTRLSSRLSLAAPSLRQKEISITRRKSNGERLIETPAARFDQRRLIDGKRISFLFPSLIKEKTAALATLFALFIKQMKGLLRGADKK